MNIKIFCRCGFFPSWSGKGLISTPVQSRIKRATRFGLLNYQQALIKNNQKTLNTAL